ncbi:MAG: hypothetical protein CK532_01815 [Flavobacteriales bacterium]|nr:MAG: hypothetical protein CK532_01815 [Flavobacteriales bacterium]
MEITGKIVQSLPKQTGNAKNGSTWEKQEYIIEVPGQYPKKVCFNLWGDKIAKFNVQDGDEVSISVDIESREYLGRWYTDIRAWNISKQSSSSAVDQGSSAPVATMPPNTLEAAEDGPFDDSDLPF